LGKSGKEGLFGQYKEIVGEHKTEERKVIQKVDEPKRELFKYIHILIIRYNRMMDSTTFSPPITSFSVNLKRDFPKVFSRY
jgi:hypothetical protein